MPAAEDIHVKIRTNVFETTNRWWKTITYLHLPVATQGKIMIVMKEINVKCIKGHGDVHV